MTNYVQEGKILTLVAPYTVTSGQGALVGTIFGVATGDITSAASGEFMTQGVFDLTKDTSVFAAGDRVYWDNSAKKVSSTATANTLIGRAARAALTGDATGRVILSVAASATSAFQSSEQTGTGSAQNVAHGLGRAPGIVIVYPTDTSPSTLGSYTVSLGTHTSTNVVLTVTSGKKFIVVAF